MKKLIIINSHLYSGSEILYNFLASHPLIQGIKQANNLNYYYSNFDILKVCSQNHKSKSKKSFFIDEISHNYLLSTKLNYEKLFIIAFVRRPKETIESIVRFRGIKPLFALRYYQYRLNRIYQISKIAKNFIFINSDSFNESSSNKIKEFINFKEEFLIKKEIFNLLNNNLQDNYLSKEHIAVAEEIYEKYHYLLTSKSQ